MRYIKGRETYKITPHYFSFCFPIYRTPPRSEHTYFNSDYPLAELKTLIICGQGDKTWIRKSITGRSSIWMDNESKIRLRAEGSSSHHFPQIKTVLQVTESHSVVSSSLRPQADGQGGLAGCNSWGRKESDKTEWLIWSDLKGSLIWPLEKPQPWLYEPLLAK